MAITLLSSPATHTPAFNDQWFTATSNQTAQPNFQFYITVTVHYHNGTAYTTAVENEAHNLPVDNILRFNARGYAEAYTAHYIPFNTNGWNQCRNGILKIIVNVGERYGATPVVYAGANTTYYTWNASLDTMEAPGNAIYSAATYVASVGSTFPILNDYPDTRVSDNSQNFLYILADGDNVVQKARITSSDGFITLSFNITNPLLASGNWYDRYLSLCVSPWYLSTLGGVNWIGVAGTNYTVELYDSAGAVRKTVTYAYSDVCSKFYKYQQIYLNRKGAFDHLNFELVSTEEYDIDRTKVKHNLYSDPSGAGTQTYLNYTPANRVMTTSYNKTLTLNSCVLTDAQSATLLDLATSPVIYLQDLMITTVYSKTTIYSITSADTQYKRMRHFNAKTFNILSKVNLSHTNYRQKGA